MKQLHASARALDCVRLDDQYIVCAHVSLGCMIRYVNKQLAAKSSWVAAAQHILDLIVCGYVSMHTHLHAFRQPVECGPLPFATTYLYAFLWDYIHVCIPWQVSPGRAMVRARARYCPA